jgi:hypothetical protein
MYVNSQSSINKDFFCYGEFRKIKQKNNTMFHEPLITPYQGCQNQLDVAILCRYNIDDQNFLITMGLGTKEF